KVLSDYRDQGIIKAWGMGVNKIRPILDCMEAADPNICLSATQYSILEHDDAVEKLLPKVKEFGVKLVSGAGYNSGFIAGRDRYNYKEMIPHGMEEKRKKISQIAKNHGTNIIAAAMHFVLAADEFASIIPGASKVSQVEDNVEAWKAKIPHEFWEELKEERLIHKDAQIPAEEPYMMMS
ncbi:MAG: aldo/keto reductase, partial [Flavobacteriaceae bacterium]|nr:aldo/keto reductase [Flavobacteriaceae bacterium]